MHGYEPGCRVVPKFSEFPGASDCPTGSFSHVYSPRQHSPRHSLCACVAQLSAQIPNCGAGKRLGAVRPAAEQLSLSGPAVWSPASWRSFSLRLVDPPRALLSSQREQHLERLGCWLWSPRPLHLSFLIPERKEITDCSRNGPCCTVLASISNPVFTRL